MPGNRDKLIQAFLNLVKNAAEAIAEGREPGRIVLRTAFRPGMRMAVPGSGARVSLPLMIEVEDNGPGVPDGLKPHLFDPFVTTKRTGTGLGLALVAKIIGDHGGVIECESVPKHTVFRVLLPLQDRRRAALSKEKGHARRNHPDRGRRHRHPHGVEPGAGAGGLCAARHRQRRHAVALGVAGRGRRASSPTW